MPQYVHPAVRSIFLMTTDEKFPKKQKRIIIVAAIVIIASLLLPALPFIAYVALVIAGNIADDMNRPTKDEVAMAIGVAQFDPLPPEQFARYERLKAYLDDHLKTLLDYRNRNNTVSIVGEDNETRETVEFQECHTFYRHHSWYDEDSIHPSLKTELDMLWHQAGPKTRFTICGDGVINIDFKSEYLPKGIGLHHVLTFDSLREYGERRKDYRFFETKEKTLSDECVYTIGLTVDVGR
jgi:hypothetical protein